MMNDLLESRELKAVAAANPVPIIDRGRHCQPNAQRLLADLLATPPNSRRPRRVTVKVRRRVAITGTSVVLLGAVGGVAAAAGLIPEGVTRAFRALGTPGNGVDDAHMVVQTTTPNGISLQIWIGHNSEGGACEYDRTVAANGTEDGSVGCFSGPDGTAPGPQPTPDAFTGGLEPAGKPFPLLTYEVTAITTLPSVTRISLVYNDGEVLPLSFNRDTGYAVGVVPARLDPHPSHLNAYDAAGHVIATIAQHPTGCASFACATG